MPSQTDDHAHALIELITTLRDRNAPWGCTQVGTELRPLRAALNSVLRADIRELVTSSRLAFASPESLDYPTDTEDARRMRDEGRTAILQGLQMDPGLLNQVAARLETSLKRRVACSAYISARADASTFSMHVDRWDGFLIQLSGQKLFEVRDASGATECLPLKPGDMLMIRQGTPHRANARSASVHISLNVLDFPSR